MDETVRWFERVATGLKVIQHTQENRRFARNVDELLEGLSRKIPCKHFTLVLEEPHGQLVDSGQNDFKDLQTVSFMVLKHIKTNDWAGEEQCYAEAKAIFFKIVGKALEERRRLYAEGDASGVMRFIETSSIRYRREIIKGKDLVGVQGSFQRLLSAHSGLAYEASDWLQPQADF